MNYWHLMICLCGLCLTAIGSRADPYFRPFGDNAPWNVPVARIKPDPASQILAERLWNEAAGNRKGNLNLSFEGYTYPVYDVSDASGLFTVRTRTNTTLDGTKIPWNPKWRPGDGSDGQVILIDPKRGIEWDLWQVEFDGTTIWASNGSRLPGDYRTREQGHPPSRGAGIPYLAMLVRPEEIRQGEIRHALSLAVRNTDGERFVSPATKLEFPGRVKDGIPEGTRFALKVTEAEIEEWISQLPEELSERTRQSAAVIARALRDYGCFVTDTAGGAHLQFESRHSAGSEWSELGLDKMEIEGKEYPRDLLDGLITQERIYALVPSDQYPKAFLAR